MEELYKIITGWTLMEWLEALSYIATIIGFPFAIWVFWSDGAKERDNEDEEIYQQLSDEYNDFLKLLLTNADLGLLGQEKLGLQLSDEQQERKRILFEMLISIFERAYILIYEENMTKQEKRRWQSWFDWQNQWLKRKDFREALPVLLEGEDPDFVTYIKSVANQKS